MSWWDEQAGQLQKMGIKSEFDKEEVYSDEQVRMATVYTRQDIILIVSLLSSLNQQIRTVKYILAFIAITGLYYLIR